MTKIQITPAYRDVKPQGFYVYIHRRISDGTEFYVGKGKSVRGFSAFGRSSFWKKAAIKNGVDVTIVQEGMDEDCAYLLEQWLIAKLRHEGARLVNICSGGTGSPGFTPKNRKGVYSSQGEFFESSCAAARFLRESGYLNAVPSAISSCCSGRQGFAYGRSWSRLGVPEAPPVNSQSQAAALNFKSLSKPVLSSSYGRFSSIMDAIRYLKISGYPLARSSNITRSCRSGTMLSYGSRWSYE